ncbi:MAG: putative entry exclusion protein TrbK-alt [Alphaproteobacteria bacterium]|nr:putative entry exclusion protein TrbK-alt [Alphaproteobacteria bacterium]
MEQQTSVHVTVIVSVVTFVAAMLMVLTMELSRDSPSSSLTPQRSPVTAGATGEALRRCRDLGEAATRDAGCLRLWAAGRDAFLGRTGQKP